MKRLIISAAIMAASFSAAAGNNNGPTNNNEYNTYNQQSYTNPTANAGASASSSSVGVGLGVGVGVGLGGEGGKASSASSLVGSGNSAQTQSATGGTSSAVGGTAFGGAAGSGSAVVGGVSGNSTHVAVDASTVMPKPASANAYAPEGSAPRTSCRIFMGLGGTGRDGSLSGGIPIGNDQTCISGAQVEFMNNVNRVAPGTFTGPDYLMAACKVEGMDQMSACKK